jgi:membrane fusion protein (multidrug efflux system)
MHLTAGCSREASETGGDKQRIFTVNVAEARQEDLGRRLELSGELAPLRQVLIVPPIPGRVAEIKVREGDRVAEGQLIIRMDNTQQALQLRQAEIEVEAGRLEVEKLAYLVEQGAAAEYTLRQARKELAKGEALLELARYAYDVTFLKSPLAGVVGYIWAREGEMIGNTQAALVMDIDQVLVQLTVDEGQLSVFSAKMAVQVEIPALGGVPRRGVVSYISQAALPGSRTFQVKVTVDNPEADLKPGMFARVLVEGESRGGVLVPGGALREEDGRSCLFIVTGSRVARRDVETGLRRDGKVEIVKGLQPGELYVSRIPAGMQDGSIIEVMEEE